MMNIITWVINLILSAVAGYFVEKILRQPIQKWWRYLIGASASLIVFVAFAYFSSPYVQDVFKAMFSTSIDRQCFFDSEIYSPAGAPDETGASSKRYEFPLNTTISWEPNGCVMVVQAYQDNKLLTEVPDLDPDVATIQQATGGRTGVVEIKIFRKGFKTTSSNTWITAVAP